uniref:Uncharacterized protein n=1 Tax=Siphoviridae sp. ctLOE2 TaxID=2825454 RepID=A0A8S5PGA9_9CAUD|nr:MAG TPA: hypothetical protein [Siphoviridae sp. ctLOE2]
MKHDFLYIEVDSLSLFDEENQRFIDRPKQKVEFRYTLKNLDEWESKHKKRFLDNKDLTDDELLDFIKIMCTDKNFDFNRLDVDQYNRIIQYVYKDVPSATVLPKSKKKSKAGQRQSVFTSEILYAHMAINGIPFEWENRNLNKLMLLINTVNSLQSPPEKMSKTEAMDEQRSIIEQRRAEEARLYKEMEEKEKQNANNI